MSRKFPIFLHLKYSLFSIFNPFSENIFVHSKNLLSAFDLTTTSKIFNVANLA